MASEIDLILRDLIDHVQQRPQFVGGAKSKQVVKVTFHTPHDFTGEVTMDLSDWNSPETRTQKVMQAIIDLEGPFWEGGGTPIEEG